jgi:hypothetical protein
MLKRTFWLTFINLEINLYYSLALKIMSPQKPNLERIINFSALICLHLSRGTNKTTKILNKVNWGQGRE